jgi:hypothetical protein
MPRVVKMFGPGEGLREVLLCDPADIVLGGLGRWWEEDVPAVVTDVPAAVQAAAPSASLAPGPADDAAEHQEAEPPASEIDEDLDDAKPRGKAGGKGRKRS